MQSVESIKQGIDGIVIMDSASPTPPSEHGGEPQPAELTEDEQALLNEVLTSRREPQPMRISDLERLTYELADRDGLFF